MKMDTGKRYPLAFRTTKQLRDRLDMAAALTGRSLSQEVEHRLEESMKSAIFGPLELRAIVVDDLLRSLEQRAQQTRVEVEQIRSRTVGRLSVEELAQLPTSVLAEALSMRLNNRIAAAERRWPDYERDTRPGRFIEGMKAFARNLNTLVAAGRRFERASAPSTSSQPATKSDPKRATG